MCRRACTYRTGSRPPHECGRRLVRRRPLAWEILPASSLRAFRIRAPRWLSFRFSPFDLRPQFLAKWDFGDSRPQSQCATRAPANRAANYVLHYFASHKLQYNVLGTLRVSAQSSKSTGDSMIIDCHGHYTSEPPAFIEFRKQQIAAFTDSSKAPAPPQISDDQIREKLEPAQLKFQRERGTDVTIFSPRASAMGHHVGDAKLSAAWTRTCNDMIHRIVNLYPKNFIAVCQLPQTPGVAPENCIGELERCVKEMGSVGCNLNPDPSGGYWKEPPLTDKWWYPFYEKMVELEVPAMVHVTGTCNPAFHTTGSHYINGDTTAFMQFLTSDLFKDFPTLKFVIPHGGGAVPYHWGRYRGIAQ